MFRTDQNQRHLARLRMEHLVLVLAILPVHFMVMMSPGPNAILLSTTALSVGRASAVRTAFGIATGSLIWMSAAALGVSVIFETLLVLGWLLKIAGGFYLIYLGFRLLSSIGLPQSTMKPNSGTVAVYGFRRGLLVNLTNPKSATYFGSIFAVFLTVQIPSWVVATVIGCFFLTSILWHCTLAVTISWDKIRGPYIRFSRIIDRIAGAVLILLGIRLFSDSR